MTASRFANWMDISNKKISSLHAILLSFLFALLSIWYHHGGILNPEMNIRLPYYLSDKPLLNKLFDIKVLDSNLYRARELSYLLDFIDSKFIEFGIRNGFPHFLSLTHYLFSVIIGCLLWQFCVRDLKLQPLTGICWLILFWTSPSIFLGGDMFRAGKIGVALSIAVLLPMIYKITWSSTKEKVVRFSKTFWIFLFITIFAATLLDEQGVFLNITIIIFLSIWVYFVRNKNFNTAILICLTSLVLHLAYRFFLAPQLTFAMNGYWPDFSYQQLSIQAFTENAISYFSSGMFLYIETFHSLTGNPPFAAASVILLLVIGFLIFYSRPQSNQPAESNKFFKLALVSTLITNLFLVIGMNAVMVYKYPPLMQPDIEIVYYCLPANILLALTLAMAAAVFKNAKFPEWLLGIALCTAIIGNIAALPAQKDVLAQGRLQAYYQSSPALLNALKSPAAMENTQDPVVRANPVFKFFSGESDLGNGIK